MTESFRENRLVSERVVPEPNRHSAPYWDAAAQHRLVLARCSRCEQFSHPPDVICPRCRHDDPQFSFQPVSGAGTVRSWITLRQSFLPGFDDDLPLVLVDVDIDGTGGVRMIGRLIDGPSVALAAGDRVEVAFEDIADNVSIPAFTLQRTDR